MIDSIKPSFPDCVKILQKNVRLDPHFADFYFWAKSHNIPVIVLSSGLTPIIRALLEKVIGTDAASIEVVCNDVVDRPPQVRDQPGGWTVQFHDDSDFGHDKSLTIRPYVKHFDEQPHESRPTMLYAGDGVSDLSAAKETDLLFAKEGRGRRRYYPCRPATKILDLITYCERGGLPYTVFKDWASVLQTTEDILYCLTFTELNPSNELMQENSSGKTTVPHVSHAKTVGST